MSMQETRAKDTDVQKTDATTSQVPKNAPPTPQPVSQTPARTPARAMLKNFPVSARKMRRLVNMVRGMHASKALASLKFAQSPHSIALEKLLLSSIANWQTKHEDNAIEENKLFIKTATVDSAHMLKRFRPAPQGRAHRIRKRYSHICFVIDTLPESQTPPTTSKTKKTTTPTQKTSDTSPRKEDTEAEKKEKNNEKT